MLIFPAASLQKEVARQYKKVSMLVRSDIVLGSLRIEIIAKKEETGLKQSGNADNTVHSPKKRTINFGQFLCCAEIENLLGRVGEITTRPSAA